MDQIDVRVRGEGHIDLVLDRRYVVAALGVDLSITALAGSTGGVYNRVGRGIPDVAANGDNIAVFVGGEFGLSGGTSASTPIFASIVSSGCVFSPVAKRTRYLTC